MRRFLEALIALLVFLAAQPAFSSEEKRVLVIVAPANDAALDAVVRERVTTAGASVAIDHAASIDPLGALASRTLPPAFAHVWIDFTGSDAVIVLLDGPMDRGLIRHASRARGDEIAREEIGHVLQTAIEALLAGMTIGIGRDDLLPPPTVTKPIAKKPKPAPLVVEQPPEPDPWHVRAGGLYAIDAFGAGTAMHGPGATFDVLHRFGSRFELGVRLLGQARFPAQITAEPFTLRIESWATRGSLLGVLRFGAWSIEASLGAGADIERVVPLTAASGSRIASPTTRATPIFRPTIGLAFGPPRVALSFVLDIGLATERYGSNATTLFSANVARPGVIVEIGTN